MKAVFNNNLKGTPARAWFNTGVIELNPRVWASLNADERRVILLHEMGHITTQSHDEILADTYAMNRFLEENPGKYYTPYKVLRDNLDNNEQYRVENMLQKSLLVDYSETGNPKALARINDIKNSGRWFANFTNSNPNIDMVLIVALLVLIILLTLKK